MAKDIAKELAKPFDPLDIEWRVQSAGKTQNGKLWAIVIPYITNRGIQERLDAVCGIDGWRNEYTETPGGKGILCGISIKFMSGVKQVSPNLSIPSEYEWITKWDGADQTAVEATKGGLSSAMKRAAVQWGIGRYLYRLEAAITTPVEQDPKNPDYLVTVAKIEGKRMRIWYKRPNLPSWALEPADDESDDGQAA